MKSYLFSTLFLVVLSTAVKGEKPLADSHGTPILSSSQRDVLSYFREVALGFEFGRAPRITRKWESEMKIYVGGSPNRRMSEELQLIVDELNSLVSDGFQIRIVDTKLESNFFIFWGSSKDYAALFPSDAELAQKNSGVFHIYWNRANEIIRGNMFVNMEGRSEQEQLHVLREELTQSLGLGNDSPTYKDSIFQSKWTIPVKYAEVDKELIRLLYHPKMAAGLNTTQVEALITEIYLAENSTMY